MISMRSSARVRRRLPTLQQLRHAYWSRHLFSDFQSAWRYAGAQLSRKRRKPVSLRVRALGGVPITCRPGTSDAGVLWDTFEKTYHAPKRPLRRDATIVDLGCNVGYTLLHLAALCPEGRLIGVELDAGNAAMSRQNTAQLGSRCAIVEGAIWTEDGTISYGGEQEWGFSIVSTQRDRTARALTLTTLFNELCIGPVDYLKMDIEGAEDAIFRQDLGWLDRVEMAQIEVHPPCTTDIITDGLGRRGFQCQIDPRPHPAVFGHR